jgi:cysteinyl-tRNA synthetase
VADGDVYFDITADKDYGKLSNRQQDDQQAHGDLEGGKKRNPGDFALWKAAKPHEPEAVRYDSPWGKGRPGWHIECSAMSMRYLGETFDIHGGGMDLIFPHHENEIAQAETATEQPFVKYWLHNGLTRFNTKKVSKSDRQMAEALKKMTLTTLLDTYGGELLRYFVASTHYRRPIEFTDEELEGKRRGLNTFHRLFERIQRIAGKSAYDDRSTALAAWESADKSEFKEFAADAEQFIKRFYDAMDDDFNTAAALASMFEFANRINRFIEERELEKSPGDSPAKHVAYASTQGLMALGRLLGLFTSAPEKTGVGDELVDSLMDILIAARAEARKARQFAIADMIRDRLGEAGVTLEDRPDGTIWRR